MTDQTIPLIRPGEEIWLNLGSGAVKGQGGWTAVDKKPGCDLPCDLTEGIPLPDESVSRIYSSHFLEHLTYSEIQDVFKESLRVLVDGGSFSVCVPNSKIFIEAYVDNRELPEEYFKVKPAFRDTTKLDYVNYIAYMRDTHRYMFDQEHLLYLLGQAGFTNVRKREFDPSVDKQERQLISVYAEAEK